MDVFLKFEETEQSKIFANQAFGYWKIVVERPLRLRSQFTVKAIESLRYQSGDEEMRRTLYSNFGPCIYQEFAVIRGEMEETLTGEGDSDTDIAGDSSEQATTAVPEKRRKKLLDAESWTRDHMLVEAVKRKPVFVAYDFLQSSSRKASMLQPPLTLHGLASGLSAGTQNAPLTQPHA